MMAIHKRLRRLFSTGVLCFTFLFSCAQQLVLRGDYPDPSAIKIGDTYWASATTSNWMPALPILKSKDLIHWQTVSHVFPKLPDWADYYFWAPELSYDNGKVYVYYAAHKKGGNLCVGVASADKPEGPYTDHGPLICQEDGSIDAFPMRDEHGKLFLIWKEDANSIGRPTPIWAQELNEERTKLVGEKTELFRNDVAWEMNLVEGVSMIRHSDYFYAFYAAAGCCGAACTYGVGIARSKSLSGPWEKYPGNPVLTKSEKWNCPGHGTPIEKDGKYFFLYHAYDKKTGIFTGREGVLSEYRFTKDDWIEFVKDSSDAVAIKDFADDFKGKTLSKDWQWSVFQQPDYKIGQGHCYLYTKEGNANFLAQKTVTGNYVVTAKLDLKRSSAIPGITVIGDEKNFVAAICRNDSVVVLQVKDGKEIQLAAKGIRKTKACYLQLNVKNAVEASFSFATNKKSYTLLHEMPINISFLPPWDRAIRVGLFSKGIKGTVAVFDSFKLENNR